MTDATWTWISLAVLFGCFLFVSFLNLRLLHTLTNSTKMLYALAQVIEELKTENERYLVELTARREAAGL